MFILAQILSFIAMLINMIEVQLKTKKHILLTIVVSNLLFVISYILLDAYVGALTCGIVAIEIIINTILEDKGFYKRANNELPKEIMNTGLTAENIANTVKFVFDLPHEITIPSIEVRHIKNY